MSQTGHNSIFTTTETQTERNEDREGGWGLEGEGAG